MFRFTVRDLLWMTMVVALAVGWWVDRRKIADDLYWTRINWHINSGSLHTKIHFMKQQLDDLRQQQGAENTQ